MRTATKIWLITAALFVVVGLIMLTAVMSNCNWNLSALYANKYETKIYEVNENFENISIKSSTANITLMPSEDGKCKVECLEEKKEKHSVEVKEGTLIIKSVNKKSWYDYFRLNFGQAEIKVYLPPAEYSSLTVNGSIGNIKTAKDFKFENADITLSIGDVDFFAAASDTVKIKTTTGSINIENEHSKSLDLSASTGKITLSNVTCDGDIGIKVSTGKTVLTDVKCKNLTSSGSTGSIYLNNVIASEKINIKRSTGTVKFEGSDADEIFVKTSTGNVSGSLITDKIFITDTDTGSIDVPKSTTGGKCEITTDTGNIKISINRVGS